MELWNVGWVLGPGRIPKQRSIKRFHDGVANVLTT